MHKAGAKQAKTSSADLAEGGQDDAGLQQRKVLAQAVAGALDEGQELHNWAEGGKGEMGGWVGIRVEQGREAVSRWSVTTGTTPAPEDQPKLPHPLLHQHQACAHAGVPDVCR